MQEVIEQRLTETLDPVFVEVVDETHMHNVPSNAQSHFKLTVVSPEFEGKTLLQQHRLVNEVLAAEIPKIHALAIHTYTPDEWFERAGQAPASPQCMGGSKPST